MRASKWFARLGRPALRSEGVGTIDQQGEPQHRAAATTSSPEKENFGHRGASGHAPDNTLTGLRIAAELGADACEIDIQRTADGRCAVIHDAFLRSADGRVLPVQRSTLDELQRVPLAGGERVPTLEEMLELAGDLRLGLYIEVKDGAAIPLLIDALHDAKATRRVMVGSFRPDWVAEVGALDPELRTAVLFGSAHMDAVALARSTGASRLQLASAD